MNPRKIRSRALRISGRIDDSPQTSALPTLIEPTDRKSLAHLLFVLLGLAVVLWGIQYKLSLYRSATVQRSIPTAKLLSQKERPEKEIAEIFSVKHTRLPFATPAAIAPPFSSLPEWSWGQFNSLPLRSSLPALPGNVSPLLPFHLFSPRAPPAEA